MYVYLRWQVIMAHDPPVASAFGGSLWPIGDQIGGKRRYSICVRFWPVRSCSAVRSGLRDVAVVELLSRAATCWKAGPPCQHGRSRDLLVPGRWSGRLIVELVVCKVFYEVFGFLLLTHNESLQPHAARAHRPKTRPPGGPDLRPAFICH